MINLRKFYLKAPGRQTFVVTLSVIGVGVRLAVCLKGAKIGKSLFGGYVISTVPKLQEMLEGLQVDLRAKFGPLSAI